MKLEEAAFAERDEFGGAPCSSAELGEGFLGPELPRLEARYSGAFIRTACAPLAAFASLPPAERDYGVVMKDVRRQAYTSGRIAAALALQAAAAQNPCVIADEFGVPIFPNGYAGSIAHKHGRAIAVAAPADRSPGWGIDLEFDEASCDLDLFDEVFDASERDALPALLSAEHALRSPVTLVLAIKEAIFKAVFPRHRVRFGFSELVVAVNATDRSFKALRIPGSPDFRVDGYYTHHNRWLATIARLTPI